MPDQVFLMREALELAANETASEEERETGLLNLQELVSDMDNACARPPAPSIERWRLQSADRDGAAAAAS